MASMKAAVDWSFLISRATNNIGINSGSQTIVHRFSSVSIPARWPLVLTTANFAFAVLVVTIASVLSSLVVLRKLGQLDLVGALKAPG